MYAVFWQEFYPDCVVSIQTYVQYFRLRPVLLRFVNFELSFCDCAWEWSHTSRERTRLHLWVHERRMLFPFPDLDQ
jgi:hypothetical protein